MTKNKRQSPSRPDQSGPSGLLLGSGVALFAVVCCAGPVLLAAGAFGVLGGWLGNPWVIGGAIALLTASVILTVRRRNGARLHTTEGHADDGSDRTEPQG